MPAKSPGRDSLLPRTWLPTPGPIHPALSSWLDALRWASALFVCLNHVRSALIVDYGSLDHPGLAAAAFYWFHGFSHQAVIVFFFLSGYLVGGEVLGGLAQGKFCWRTYGIRRFSRLYAVYLVALPLGVCWDTIGLHFFNLEAVTHSQAFPMVAYSVTARLTPTIFLGNLFMCQTVLVPTLGSNSSLWSLANETWYYVLLPLALWPLFGQRPRWQGVLSVMGLVAGAWFVRGDILLYFSVWLLGLAPHFLKNRLPLPRWVCPILLGGLLVSLRLHFWSGHGDFWSDLAIAVIFALWLNQKQYRPSPGTVRFASLNRQLAGFSYSLYLVHWPLALLLSVALQQQYGSGRRFAFGLGGLGLYLLVLAAVYGVAWLVAQVTERQSLHLRRWLLEFLPGGSQ